MSNKKEDVEPTPVNEEAAAWALRLRNGNVEITDSAYLDWLSQSADHRKAMEQAHAVWSLFGEQAAAPEVVRARRDALSRAGREGARRWQGFTRLPGDAKVWFGAVAAALLLGLVVVPATLLRSPVATYATDVGETRTVTLSDNTRVSLDAASAIEAHYKDGIRGIRLRNGQAYFDVAKDPARPFRVTAGDRTVLATGTSFNVELVENEVRVTLLEGEVVVAEKASFAPSRSVDAVDVLAPVTLKPGQQLVAAKAAPPEIEEADVEKTNAWRRGKVMLEGDHLDLAIERMNRYSRIRIDVGDKRLNDYRISGIFNAGDTDAFVDAIESYFPIEARRVSASSIVLYQRS